MKRLSLIAIIIIFAVPCLAANLYVTPSGAGAANGSDWSNALPWTFTPVRGNVYYLAGGTYTGTKALSTATSGTTTITLRKATAANSGSVSGWQSSYANQFILNGYYLNISTSYWVIDGVSRTTETSGHGIKLVGYAGGFPSTAVYMGSGTTHNNITVQYCEITGAVTPITDACTDDGSCVGTAIYAYTGDNIVFSYNYVHDVVNPISSVTNSNFEISNNYFYRNRSTPSSHSEVLATHLGGSFTIKNNKMVDIEGTAFLAFMNQGTYTADIYNNLFYIQSGFDGEAVGDGPIGCFNSSTTCALNIYNNTFVNLKSGGGGKAYVYFESAAHVNGTVNIKNNLWFCNSGACADATSQTYTGMNYDKNWYGGVTYRSGETGAINGGSSNPFTDSASYDFTLTAGATTIDAGIDISSLFTTDYAGTTRTGTWDIGAYEYGAGTPAQTRRATGVGEIRGSFK